MKASDNKSAFLQFFLSYERQKTEDKARIDAGANVKKNALEQGLNYYIIFLRGPVVFQMR